MVMKSDFIPAVQERVARVAVSASAARGQGKGTVKAAREYLSTLGLHQFGVRNETKYLMRLEDATDALYKVLPKQSRSWGLARKLINIFLRDALYTTYLAEKYRLGAAEPFFEIPLDSITSKHLRKDAGRGVLPRWKGVKHLAADDSERYQSQAEIIGQKQGIYRVHLDTYWWGQR